MGIFLLANPQSPFTEPLGAASVLFERHHTSPSSQSTLSNLLQPLRTTFDEQVGTQPAATSASMSQPENLPPKRPRTFRRLSSEDATREALNSKAPTLVVPPKSLMEPSDAHSVAAAMELARHQLEDFSTPTSEQQTPFETGVTDKYAFAFGG